jgi:hypothetical protein
MSSAAPGRESTSGVPITPASIAWMRSASSMSRAAQPDLLLVPHPSVAASCVRAGSSCATKIGPRRSGGAGQSYCGRSTAAAVVGSTAIRSAGPASRWSG